MENTPNVQFVVGDQIIPDENRPLTAVALFNPGGYAVSLYSGINKVHTAEDGETIDADADFVLCNGDTVFLPNANDVKIGKKVLISSQNPTGTVMTGVVENNILSTQQAFTVSPMCAIYLEVVDIHPFLGPGDEQHALYWTISGQFMPLQQEANGSDDVVHIGPDGSLILWGPAPYTPATPANFTVVPTTVAEALNELAARVAALE